MVCEPVGVAEIAERLGVRPQTAHVWRYRNLLPAPKWTVSGQPAWNWPDIQKWAQETHRLDLAGLPVPVHLRRAEAEAQAHMTNDDRYLDAQRHCP